MRDIALHESRTSETLEDGFEAIVLRNVGELSFDKLSSYIRRYAEWDRVSLVCAPI